MFFLGFGLHIVAGDKLPIATKHIIILILKHIFGIIFICTTITLSTNMLFSQKRVTLDEAIAASVANNGDVQTARLGVEKSHAAVHEAYGNVYPNINLTGSYTRNILKPVFFFPNLLSSIPLDSLPYQRGSGWQSFHDALQAARDNPQSQLQKIEIGENNVFQLIGSVNQMVFNSAIFTAISTANVYEDASTENLRSTIAKTINSTRKTFYAALVAREALRTVRASLEKGQENLRMVNTMYREGVIPEFDQIRAEVGVANIEPAVLQAASGYENALNALKLSMGLPITDSIDVEGELVMPAAARYSNEAELLNRVIISNYDIKALEAQKGVSEGMISLRKSEYYPVVSVSGNYMYQGQADNFNFLTATSAAVSLNVSFNLFNGFATNARVEQARLDYLTLEDRIAQMKEALRVQLQNYLLQLHNAEKRIQVQQKTVAQAERGYQIAQIRYREGTGNLTEINESDINLRQARTNAYQALSDYLNAQSEIETLLGDVDMKYMSMR